MTPPTVAREYRQIARGSCVLKDEFVPTVVPRLILASQSPRRLELLERVGIHPEVVPADLDETRLAEEPPVDYARRLAAQKAHAIAHKRNKERPILAADTVVIVDENEVLGKPADAEEARVMLTRLSGRAHRVVTAFHILYGDAERGRAVTTEVTMRVLRPAEIQGYVGSGEWEGKAGGYAIQGLAGAFVRTVSGSYSNVVGLPVCEVLEDLDALGALPADWALG
jgi:septum formation protein